MSTFRLLIVTPDRTLFDGDVQEVIARTTRAMSASLPGIHGMPPSSRPVR